ncbi:hypothetical protein JCM8115_003243 [Rhodotorula mucilaginosa]
MLRAPRPRLVSPQVTAVAWRTAASSSSRFASFVPSHPRREQEAPKQVPVNAPKGTPIGKVLDRRLKVVFTCTAPASATGDAAAADATCGHRSSHEFSRNSYEKGVVIVQCPQCNNRHLIADHLHWFSQTPSPAHPTGQPLGSERPRTIEQLMREKGEQVRWGTAVGEQEDGVDVDPAAADGKQQVKMVMRERTEQDGGKTVEIVPAENATDPSAPQQS